MPLGRVAAFVTCAEEIVIHQQVELTIKLKQMLIRIRSCARFQLVDWPCLPGRLYMNHRLLRAVCGYAGD